MKKHLAYYNEHDSYCGEWLRNLIREGVIAPGLVDTRSIEDVTPNDLAGFTQCHFFAGIGVWSYALRLAGWADDRSVWTGSAPCQPFSQAGKAGGFDDERHLWPAWFHLIELCKPVAIFGEQVASPDGLAWLDLVTADLEGENYAVAAKDLSGACVGSPDIRQRLYFVAHHHHQRCEGIGLHVQLGEPRLDIVEAGRSSEASKLADSCRDKRGSRRASEAHGAGALEFAGRRDDDEASRMGDSSSSGGWRHGGAVPCAQGEGGSERQATGRESHELVIASADGGVAHHHHPGSQGRCECGNSACQRAPRAAGVGSYWSEVEWVLCNDRGGPKWRPIEPGSFPVDSGAANRVGRLRAYGNAIKAPLAAAFIKAAGLL